MCFRRILLATIMLMVAAPATAQSTTDIYASDWQGTRRWIGPDWWANPLTDWSLRRGVVQCVAAKDRTLCLLPVEVTGDGEALLLRVTLQRLGKLDSPAKVAAGFRFGRSGGIDDYRHALVHATAWVDAKVLGDGRLVLGEKTSQQRVTWESPVVLSLELQRQGDVFTASLTASGDETVTLTQQLSAEEITGGVALLADGPNRPGASTSTERFGFSDFLLRGDLADRFDDRSFGPILWSQYTLSGKRLRLQAQLAPLAGNRDHQAELWVNDARGDSPWSQVGTSKMDPLSRTVTFTIDQWPSDIPFDYEVRFKWRGKDHRWAGKIRNEPAARDSFKLACFSCDNGYLFPIPAMVSQVKRQDPDMVFFAGDQIYESYGGFGVARGAKTETAILDYLRKYYQFGWTWRDLLRDRPSVILPDDHDVFQGNIWGHGGRKLPPEAKTDWTYGGYLMPGDWVNAVEQTQVGHLPDPAVDITLPIGIKPYFTQMNYAGIGFAILEDRKFKTGPKTLPPELQKSDGGDGDLLGSEQEAFLSAWSQDWQGHVMKCALSQTIFCKAATHTGKSLKRSRFYADSGAWPNAARNRAVKLLADAKAFAIHGDQHLGVLLRHGIEDFDDAGYAFMVPGTANGFPRAWWPGVGKEQPEPGGDYRGRHRDDAGNPIDVLAVGNPEPQSNTIPMSAGPMEVGYRKGSGYGMVEFDKKTRQATVSLYRLGDSEEQFDGFPVTIDIGGKP